MIEVSLSAFPESVLLVTRLSVGMVMIYFGFPKIRDLKANARDFTGMGFKPGWLWGTPIALLEFFGGILLLAGVYAEIIALVFGIQMIVGALWKVRAGKGFPDYSYDILLLALCLVIVAFGAGTYALFPLSFS